MIKKIANYVTSFATHAVTRRLKADAFIQVDKTPHRIIYKKDIISLRYYLPLTETEIEIEGMEILVAKHSHHIPILLVPPLGVYAWVFDLLVKRSFVRFLMAHGFHVYLVDWGTPGNKEAHISLTDYVLNWMPTVVEKMRCHYWENFTAQASHKTSHEANHPMNNQAKGQTKNLEVSASELPISLLGYCMGGLISLLYAGSANDKYIANILTIASPIDFNAKDWVGKFSAMIKKPYLEGRRLFKQPLFKPIKLTPIRQRFFHIRGKMVSRAFRLTDPLGSIKSYLSLVRNMADREYVITYMSLSEWFNKMTDFPGATLEEMMYKFSIQNQMADGRVKIGNKIADFSHIASRILAIAGESDTIVSLEAARKLLDLVTSEDKTFAMAPGGHAGVFAGREAATNTWSICVDWLERRSN